MSQLDNMPDSERQKMADWKAPDTSSTDTPETETPQALAEKIIAGSKKNAAQTTERDGKPGWSPYEERLAVAERNRISLSMDKIQDPAVLEILQKRMGEIDQQVPDMQEYLKDRATKEDSSETYKARIENSKKEAKALLEQQLPAIEAAFADFPKDLRININETNGNIVVGLDNSPNTALKYQKEKGQQNFPGKTEQLEGFLAQAGRVVTTFPKLEGEYNLGLVWHREPSITVGKLLREIKSALEGAEEVKTPRA